MSASHLTLLARAIPDHLPLDRPCDVELELALRNDGAANLEIYPGAAKLDAITSFAGIGVTWSLALVPAQGGAPVPLLELRRWYGPPGNPPPPGAAKAHAVVLAPGRQHVERQLLCWIPNSCLPADQLLPQTLDPQGMDGVGPRSWTPPPGHALPPPLQDHFPLAQASVLVLGANATTMEASLRDQPDALRGHVVGFVPAPGAYDLKVGYAQHAWMGLGEAAQASAAAVRLHLGA